MGNEVGRSNSYVANASGKPIRIMYSRDQMRLDEMVVDTRIALEASCSANTKYVFKPDSRFSYVRISVGSFIKISGEGTLYASVFIEDTSCPDHCTDVVSLNFRIPSDRSFIVAADGSIKFQKYGASIWVDEQGNRHG